MEDLTLCLTSHMGFEKQQQKNAIKAVSSDYPQKQES